MGARICLVAVLLGACSSGNPAGNPPAGGEGGGETGGTGGATATGGKSGGTGGSTTGTGGATTVADAAPLEKDAGAPAADTAGPGPDLSGAGGGSGGGGEALMIVGTVPIIGSDIQIKEELIARGLKVSEVLDSNSNAQMAAGKKIVVLSYSIDSEQVTGKFNDAEGCIILMEHNLLPSLGMTSGSGHGYQLGATELSIIKPDHPLAAGFTGDVSVIVKMSTSDMFWGVPPETAIKIATVKGNANRVALFAYEKDAMMVGRKAPGKRLQFFLGAHNVPTKYLTADGVKVLDASIDWCVK